MALRLNAKDAHFDSQWRAFLTAPRGGGGHGGADTDLPAVVASILADVRARGGEAVADHCRTYDRVTIDPNTLCAGQVDTDEVAGHCPAETGAAIDAAAERIETFHRRQMPSDRMDDEASGIRTGWRWSRLDSVGVYVPGGRASYPSSVLMGALPARIAGVARIVMTTPCRGSGGSGGPGGRGGLTPALAYAARRAGIDDIRTIGGAQAVAALAYGAGTLAPVDKIVGPGNAYVTEAKKQVYGDVGIDSVAGPSEICILADSTGKPDWIAADLLAQAEHDPQARAVLITPDTGLADAVEAAIARQLPQLATVETASSSWANNGAIVIASLQASPPIVDAMAPEHLHLALDAYAPLLARIRHAGAIFLGPYSPEVLGDYITGPNHVLPTGRTARFLSGLSILDFMKRTTIQQVSEQGFAALGPGARALANAEGLPAHAYSVSVRLDK